VHGPKPRSYEYAFPQKKLMGALRSAIAAKIADGKFTVVESFEAAEPKTKLYRAGQYPPLRGTLLTLDDQEMILYTRGSVPFFETYPGKYIPNPLRVRIEAAEQTPQYLAREILALTKMNWNNTLFDGAEPVTIRASRQCSSVLRYCSEGRQIEPRYSFYM